jgi:hypothetical protein
LGNNAVDHYKITVLFYNAMRFGMEYQEPSADHSEQKYRDRVVKGPWPACQKAPSVVVTWGWGSHDLLADLGNNADSNSLN